MSLGMLRCLRADDLLVRPLPASTRIRPIPLLITTPTVLSLIRSSKHSPVCHSHPRAPVPEHHVVQRLSLPPSCRSLPKPPISVALIRAQNFTDRCAETDDPTPWTLFRYCHCTKFVPESFGVRCTK